MGWYAGVHGAGSNTFVENLSGRLSPYRYRLGLSATPEREYDEVGNDFLLNEIGEVIFEFTLQDAIQKGILCEFNYIPLPYVLTEEEKLKKRRIIATFNAKKDSGELVDEKDMYASSTSSDFKLAFKQYVKNKFDANAKENDLKQMLMLIEDEEEDIQA